MRLRRFVLVLAFIALVGLAIPLIGALIECRPAAQVTLRSNAARVSAIQGIAGYQRGEEQTYLTLPEWFIVFNMDDYAAHIATQPPSSFPYFTSVGQYWNAYYSVCRETRRYPFNGGYQLMLGVIGESFTVENAVKGLYEITFGRLTEAMSTPALSAEDAYARTVFADYGAFTHTIPWFQYPFGEKLRGLWSSVPLIGPNQVRKIERRLSLTFEFALKSGYAALLRAGTAAAYGAAGEDLEIHAWVTGITREQLAATPDVVFVREVPGGMIVRIPRYEAFTRQVPVLIAHGARFVEIAGNSEIMLTVFAPPGAQAGAMAPARVMFSASALGRPGWTRIGLSARVDALHTLVPALTAQGMVIEHFFDY